MKPKEHFFGSKLTEPLYQHTECTLIEHLESLLDPPTFPAHTDTQAEPNYEQNLEYNTVEFRHYVLTQRNSIRELVLQVEDLSKGPQELQNHQSFSKKLRWKTGSHWNWNGKLLKEPTHSINSGSLKFFLLFYLFLSSLHLISVCVTYRYTSSILCRCSYY